MDSFEVFKAVLALMFVLGLIAAAAWAARRYAPSLLSNKPKGTQRLGVVESLQIDARHRLVLVRRDERQHLILIGPSQCHVVEQSTVETGATT